MSSFFLSNVSIISNNLKNASRAKWIQCHYKSNMAYNAPAIFLWYFINIDTHLWMFTSKKKKMKLFLDDCSEWMCCVYRTQVNVKLIAILFLVPELLDFEQWSNKTIFYYSQCADWHITLETCIPTVKHVTRHQQIKIFPFILISDDMSDMF